MQSSDAHDTLAGIAVDDLDRAIADRRLAEWSDERLTAAAARVIAVPKVAPADSFVLHAPLELLARRGLLRFLPVDDREGARRRIVWLAATYEAAGEGLVDERSATLATSGDAAWRLAGAIAAGDLDNVDAAAAALGELAGPAEIARLLAPSVVTSLAAAAHASILLDLLPRVAPEGELTGGLVRGPARELARNAEWQLRWFEDPDDPVVGVSFIRALRDVPPLGLPGSNFIQPIMAQAEDSGLAPRLLSGLVTEQAPAPRQVGIELARVAGWSMLQEPTDHAPYGWTHCLTMPQAVMALATRGVYPRPVIASAVASTYVVGFRAALGSRHVDPTWAPPRPTVRTLTDALHSNPDEAAAWVWHAAANELGAIQVDLAGRAAQHEDAHLVKYTLACFDAAANDPGEKRLYTAACARLHAWWLAQA